MVFGKKVISFFINSHGVLVGKFILRRESQKRGSKPLSAIADLQRAVDSVEPRCGDESQLRNGGDWPLGSAVRTLYSPLTVHRGLKAGVA